MVETRRGKMQEGQKGRNPALLFFLHFLPLVRLFTSGR
jgi:hypothetical protein